MKHYIDVVMVEGAAGTLTSASGAGVQVVDSGTLLPVTIYSDDGVTPKANPTFTDSVGRFDFYVADGRYNLIVTGAGFAPFTAGSIEIADLTEESALDRVWQAASLQLAGTLFASLGTPANGTLLYCNDCTIANPCAGSGTGAIAKRLNGVWVCN